ncbi:8077_t:CDS:2, partial [Diversispora eburnea]
RTYKEFITNPLTFTPTTNKIINHFELPSVTDELSITLNLTVTSHGGDWACVFRKGNTDSGDSKQRTPSLWLTANNSFLHPRFSITDNGNFGSNSDFGTGLLTNRWYHIAYTLSDTQKRMDIYIDGIWTGFSSIQRVRVESVIFNDLPLYIGKDLNFQGFTGQMSKFRFYNFRLSPQEVLIDYSGEDPTKITVVKCSSGILAGSIVGTFFSGIIFSAGCLFLLKRKRQSHYEDEVGGNKVVETSPNN